jgi:hypothetical protein
MKNLTYDQLIELAPKDRPFQIEVNKKIYWAIIDSNEILKPLYTKEPILISETITLIDPKYQKPEVLKVGQKVRIMKSARKCGNYEEWGKEFSDLIGTIDIIEDVYDNPNGVYYYLQKMRYMPSYCVMPVEEKEDDLTVKLLINDLEELLYEVDNNTHNELKDIISKYKK